MDLVEIHKGGGYSSDDDSDKEERKRKRYDLAVKEKPKQQGKAKKDEFVKAYDKEEGSKQRYHLSALDSYNRHKQVVNMYLLYCRGSTSLLQRDTSKDKTDADVIRENHQFLWDEDKPPTSWEQRLAKKYYDKLFKEYALADLTRYKDNKVALRWRLEKEVVEGKGQFSCGNKRCDAKDGLRTWEVNFAYMEGGEKRNALVKLRLCSDCSFMLNYNYQNREVKKRKRDSKEETRSTEVRGSFQRTVDPVTSSKEASVSQDCDDAGTSKPSGSEAAGDDNVWTKTNVPTEEQTRESQFEEYLQDLLL